MKKIIITLSSVLILLILCFLIFNNNKVKNKEIIEADNIESSEVVNILSENNKEDKDENITEPNKDNNKNIETNDSSIHSSNKNNMESNSSSNSNVINNKTESVKEVKTETITPTPKEEPKTNNEEKEIKKEVVKEDVVDTNSWFYSIHHGQIDTSTQDKCLSAGDEIAFIDTVDINYFRCYEVTSTTGKVLGYYLNIFCNSDNCNRYKNQINMSKYR